MYPPPIDEYLSPPTLEAALAALAERGPRARILAGGMSLMRLLKARTVAPSCLLDLGRIEGLRGIEESRRGVCIGALTRYKELAHEPRLDAGHRALRDAARMIGDRQVRNRGTIGGNLCFNDVAADLPPVALALDAEIEIARYGAEPRTMAAAEFLRDAGHVALDATELVTAVHLPVAGPRSGSAYRKYGVTVDGPPVVGVAVAVALDLEAKIASARIAVGGVLPRCRRALGAERALVGCRTDDTASRAAALALAADEVETQGDLWASASYRRTLIRDLGAATLELALTCAGGAS